MAEATWKIWQKSLQKRSHVLGEWFRACETMLANCMNQYLNTDYEARKSGDPNDLIDLFIFYYSAINAPRKLKQLQVVKNCSLLA
jgi:hypothetical protein